MDILGLFHNKFYFDLEHKKKFIVYDDYKLYKSNYELRALNKELNIGEQLCDFINTDFTSKDSIKTFIKKYGITLFLNIKKAPKSKEPISKNSYEKLLKNIYSDYYYDLKEFSEDLVTDIQYIYNMNNLIELEELTPYQRYFALLNSDRFSKAMKHYRSEKVKINFSAFEWINKYNSYSREDVTLKLAKKNIVNAPFFYECDSIISALIIELSILAHNNIEIKKCKNCGKYFVPENRSDEIFCNNIYENNKTCKEIGHFKVKQKEIQDNELLRQYRNVYQKLLLRTRRNPSNIQYARDFEDFKDANINWRESIRNGKNTENEYLKWLKKQ